MSQAVNLSLSPYTAGRKDIFMHTEGIFLDNYRIKMQSTSELAHLNKKI